MARFLRAHVGTCVLAMIAVVVSLVDVREGSRWGFGNVTVAMPLLCAAMSGPVCTAVMTLWCLAWVATFTAVMGSHSDMSDAGQLIQLGVIAVCGAAAVTISTRRKRRDELLGRVTSLADATQDAILRPPAAKVGRVACAFRYRAAFPGARVGGDLVEVIETSFGVRLLIGDACGSGLGLIRLAERVLGAFREQAFLSRNLPDLAVALDRAARRVCGEEDFVTALLAEIHTDGTTTLASCGHPGPILVSACASPARILQSPSPAAPLGLLAEPPTAAVEQLEGGDRLLFVTDGVLEARQRRRFFTAADGEFFDATGVAGAAFQGRDLATGLDVVVQRMTDWTRGRLRDDAALLAIEIPPTR
jgi:hypothetical protein